MARRTRVGLAATALTVSFLAGIAVAEGLSESTPPAEPPIRLTDAALRPATSCEQLRQWYVGQALEQVTAWGWGNPYPVFYADDTVGGSLHAARSEAATTPQAASPGEAVGSSGTGTNVQEAGVDEPDSVKTDGSLLVTLEGGRLTTYDVSGDGPRLLASMVLPDLVNGELLLVDGTVVAVGADGAVPSRRALPGRIYPGLEGDTRVTTVDVDNPSAPTIRDSRVFDARTIAVRQLGDVVRLVLTGGLPHLPFVSPDRGSRGERDALAHNRRVVRESTIEDWLPSVRDGLGGDPGSDGSPAVACSDVALPKTQRGLGTTTVVAFHADDPDHPDTTAVAADTQTAYLSADRLYLASSPWQGGWIPQPIPEPVPVPTALPEPELAPEPAPDASPSLSDSLPWPLSELDRLPSLTTRPRPQPETTHLYAFALDGTETRYLAAGEVEGQVADRWAMDAVDGTLRVAVGPTWGTEDSNSLVTLEERGGALVEAGRVDALGPGEEIKSVRWFDDLAVLVTFRQTDPLYAVDLADPAAPRLLGELKIPGFSEYLHPIGGDLLLGVGQDATPTGRVKGAQLALFDLGDPTSPRRLDRVSLGAADVLAGRDPRQFTWLPDRDTALTVTASWRTGSAAVLVAEVDGDHLSTRTVPVRPVGSRGAGTADATIDEETTASWNPARIRLVPLTDGRVVLWTGSDVSPFPL
jgi:Beta propeller domain